MDKQAKIGERFLQGGVIFVNNKGICKTAEEVDNNPIPTEEIKLCLKWFKKFAQKTTDINTDAFSYTLKYIIRDYFNQYVSNGAVVQAGMILGYNIEKDGINAYFNLEMKEDKENV